MGKATNIYLTDPEVQKLKKLSRKTGLSASEIIRRAIDEYFERKMGEGRSKGRK